MAVKNKIIRNPVTRHDIEFLSTPRDTDGRLLEMKATYHEQSKEPPLHYHPFQHEDFLVLAGQLTVRIDGQVRVLVPGDALHIPANKKHAMWNGSPDETIVQWKVSPALQTDHLLETTAGLANEGKTNRSGMPGILQVALMANKFSSEFRLSKPPFLVQKILFALLTPVAYVFGYRPTYQKYLD